MYSFISPHDDINSALDCIRPNNVINTNNYKIAITDGDNLRSKLYLNILLRRKTPASAHLESAFEKLNTYLNTVYAETQKVGKKRGYAETIFI